jgi:hypothetical protein
MYDICINGLKFWERTYHIRCKNISFMNICLYLNDVVALVSSNLFVSLSLGNIGHFLGMSLQKPSLIQ